MVESPSAPFTVSAPGKVIVTGEHGVVYGTPAIAAATSLRSYVTVAFESSLHDGNDLTLELANIGLRCSWSFARIKAVLPSNWGSCNDPLVLPPVDPVRKVPIFDNAVETLTREAQSTEVNDTQLNATRLFLTLFLKLGLGVFKRQCKFAVRSDLPVGAGLGSSASMSVCLSAAMIYQRARSRAADAIAHVTEDRVESVVADAAFLQAVINWSLEGERCIHGTPSGVDSAVATLGRAVHFQRGPEGAAVHGYVDHDRPAINAIPDFPRMELLLVDTCTPRSTADEVSKVQMLRSHRPPMVEAIFAALSHVVKAIRLSLEALAREPDELVVKVNERLGKLLDVNHSLLASLGVSHPQVERVRYTVAESGAGWAKMTGAGGGGCVLILLRNDVSGDAVRTLRKGLECMHMKVYELVLGGHGVRIKHGACLQ